MKVECKHCHKEMDIAENEIAKRCDCGEWYKKHGSVTAYMALKRAENKPKGIN